MKLESQTMKAVVSRLNEGNGLALAGAVDSANAGQCEADGLALIAQLSAGAVVCDLAGLTTGNSVTAAVLMSWRRAAAKRQQVLTLRAIPERLQAILQASNLLPVFTSATHEPQ